MTNQKSRTRPVLDVILVREIDVPGFPASWGLRRVVDSRKEAGGFATPQGARAWAFEWNCRIVKEAK